MTDGCDSGHLQQLVQRALAGESDRSLKFGRGEGMWLVSLLIVFFHTESHHSGCHCCAQWSCHAPVLVCRVILLCLLEYDKNRLVLRHERANLRLWNTC